MNLPYIELHHKDKEEWLEQRKPLFTATDASSTYTGTDKAIAALWKRKHASEEVRFKGNKYTEWGHEREPIIAKYVQENIDHTLVPNSNVLVNAKNQRFGATPDMISVVSENGGEDHFITTCQIKTTKNDWGTVHDIPVNYYTQVQWEMMVTGAEVCLFVWEVYEIAGNDEFVPLTIKYGWIDADPKYHKKLAKIAEKYFNYKPRELDAAPTDFEIQILLDALVLEEEELRELNRQVREVTDRRDKVKAELLEKIGGGQTAFQYGSVVVNVAPGKPSERFDRKSFAKDFPDLEKKYLKTGESSPVLKLEWNEE